jgi:hypothetical protein
MKGYILFLLLTLPYGAEFASAQNKVLFRVDFHLQLAGRPEIGSHFLSDAHRSKGPAVDWQMSFIDFKGLRAGFGSKRALFLIDQPQTIGDFYSSRYKFRYVHAEYHRKLVQNLEWYAVAGVGSVRISQHDEIGNFFGTMTGFGTFAGMHLQLNATKWLAFTAGGEYLYHRMGIAAPQEFQSYFRHVHQVWVGGGLKVTFWEQKSGTREQGPKPANKIRYRDIKREEKQSID